MMQENVAQVGVLQSLWRRSRRNSTQAFHSPLARHLIGVTVLLSSILTFASSGTQLYITFKHDLQMIDEMVEDIRDSRSKSIVESVWVLDENLVQIQLEGIADNPDVERVAILVNGKVKWSAGEQRSTTPKVYAIDLIKNDDGYVDNLGVLQVTADIEAIQGRIKSAVAWVLISNAIKTFFVASFFVFMFYWLVGKHLVQITEYARSYRPGNTIRPFRLRRLATRADKEDELASLVASINNMITVIDHYRQEVEQNEQSVIEHAEDLALANEELEEFSARTSHDLRAPILTTISLLEVSQKSLQHGQKELVEQGIGYALSSLSTLKDLVDNIHLLTAIKKQSEKDENFDLSLLINESLEALSGMKGIDEMDVQLDLQHSGEIMSKRLWLKIIVDNLLTNAVKYRDPQKEKNLIKIKTWNEGRQLALQVEDNGMGFPKEFEKDMFRLFKRFHPNVSYGSGMGMHLMKTSAEKLDAELRYTNPGSGARFDLLLPLGAVNGC